MKTGKRVTGSSSSSSSSTFDLSLNQSCTKPSCFFCLMKEQDSLTKRATIKTYFKTLPLIDDEELILVISWLWNKAMTHLEDYQDLPSLGLFDCMTSLINKAIHDNSWLLKNQNIYIPYYASHIIGSYTMNKADFAIKAVDSGCIPPLLELLRGKMSWVEQRVAVRALGHLASYEKTFKAIAVYENEVVKLAMNLASSCLEVVYKMFVGVEERLKYHCDLLTRDVGGVEMENRKAEEWASQLQCWSIHLLNCFAMKGRCVNIICTREFLKDLCEMWGGLVSHKSPGGVGLIRILCYSRDGRNKISHCREVVESLCKLSRSSDDWQYIGIDCLLLLLKDQDTRYRVAEIATSYLVDLIELKSLCDRTNVGEAITSSLFNLSHSKIKDSNAQRALEEVSVLKIQRRKFEQSMSRENLESRRGMANLVKQQGNHKFLVGETEEAMLKYSEALELCPLRSRNERIVLYSNRAKCNLLLGDLDTAISDATRALCLCNPPNSHAKSLWTRSKAYDMKGMGKESLIDCIMFINVCVKSKKGLKIPYCAMRMINKQMDSIWLFRDAQMKEMNDHSKTPHKDRTQSKGSYINGLSTIVEEPFNKKR